MKDLEVPFVSTQMSMLIRQTVHSTSVSTAVSFAYCLVGGTSPGNSDLQGMEAFCKTNVKVKAFAGHLWMMTHASHGVFNKCLPYLISRKSLMTIGILILHLIRSLKFKSTGLCPLLKGKNIIVNKHRCQLYWLSLVLSLFFCLQVFNADFSFFLLRD